MQPSAEPTAASASAASFPLEIVLSILETSVQSCSTAHTRNVCLVNRACYERYWPFLYRIIALRDAKQLRDFSEFIYQPQLYNKRQHPQLEEGDESKEEEDETIKRLKRKQDAIECLYLNNNKDKRTLQEMSSSSASSSSSESESERPDMWMLAILLAAKNIRLLHIEEHWTISYPWETPKEKPLLAYPLMLLSNFATSFHSAFVSSPQSPWAKRLLSNRSSPHTALLEEIISFQHKEGGTHYRERIKALPHPREVTLAALAMSPTHLRPSSSRKRSGASPSRNGRDDDNADDDIDDDVFGNLTHLHLYFAKMDPLLVTMIQDLPSLTHLRLTRPFAENLSEAVTRLLDLDSGQSALSCIIIEPGLYMDRRTSARLIELEQSSTTQDRLHLADSPLPDSTTHAINWLAGTEERGFMQFAARARGEAGVWGV